MPDNGGLRGEFGDHVFEVIGNLADGLVGHDLWMPLRILDDVGIIGPARCQGRVSGLFEYGPPAVPTAR
jgi:hypothetical protein